MGRHNSFLLNLLLPRREEWIKVAEERDCEIQLNFFYSSSKFKTHERETVWRGNSSILLWDFNLTEWALIEEIWEVEKIQWKFWQFYEPFEINSEEISETPWELCPISGKSWASLRIRKICWLVWLWKILFMRFANFSCVPVDLRRQTTIESLYAEKLIQNQKSIPMR